MQLEKLTLGELDFIEKTSGLGLSEIGEKDNPKGGLLIAMVVVTKRRTGQPTYGVIEAAQLGLREAQAIIKAGPLGNPPADAAEAAAAGEGVGENATANSPSSSSDSASDQTTTSL